MPAYNVAQIGSAENGYAIEISLSVVPDGSGAATITRNQHGQVELTLWNLMPAGVIQQAGQLSADPQAGATIAALGPAGYVTAGESTQGGQIKAIFWQGVSNFEEASVHGGYHPSITAFPIRFALIPPTSPPPPNTQGAYGEGYLVATAHVTTNHHIRVTSWFVGVENLYGIGALAAANGGESIVAAIAPKRSYIAGTNLSYADVVTGAIGQGNLHLGTWRLHVEAMQPQSVEHLHGVVTSVAANEMSVATYPADPASTLVSAVVTPGGNLEIIGWHMHDDGTFTRWLETSSEPASQVSCAWCTESVVVTAFKNASGNLKLIYWQFPNSPSDPQTINQIAQIDTGAPLPYGGVSAGHWRAQNAHAANLGETLVAILSQNGNAKVIRFHLTSS
jgi:hypothetical protein